MLFGMVLVFLISLVVPAIYGQYYGQPEQVHLSLGADPTQMTVTWSTFNATDRSVVEFGLAGRRGLPRWNTGYLTKFVDGGALHHTQYIHRVTITGLQPGYAYVYHCGSPEAGWSDLFRFTVPKAGSDWSPRIALFGDMGSVNPQSIPRLQQDIATGMYDAIFHVGDFAYDFATNNGLTGDEFMRQIESIAAYLPYMTCPGNHEYHYNFTNYKNRFTMPGDPHGDRMFFSFNLGPAHIISFSSEYYYNLPNRRQEALNQYQWLEADLKEATSPSNRAERPWIITMAHRPMYCSNYDNDDCTMSESVVRTGFPGTHDAALEPLFYKYGVDLQFWAHEHDYERLFPLYNRKVYNGSRQFPYTNPGAPVHIITGSAGCQEHHDPFKSKFASWSAFHSEDYGYTRLNILNRTHIYMEQVSDDRGGAIIDKIMLIKDFHHSYE